MLKKTLCYIVFYISLSFSLYSQADLVDLSHIPTLKFDDKVINKLNVEQKNLYNKHSEKQAVDPYRLAYELLQIHHNRFMFQQTPDSFHFISAYEMMKDFRKLTPANINELDPHELKIALENSITSQNPSDLKYNITASYASSPIYSSRLNCFSGTIFYSLQQRFKDLKIYQSENHIVIFEPKHILPGYLVKEGDDYRLIGVETTVEGKGKKDYGLTKDLKLAIRVVDLDSFLFLNLFNSRGFKPKNSQEAFNAVLNFTATKYNINLKATEAEIFKLSPSTKEVQLNKTTNLNKSLFSFSSPEADRNFLKLKKETENNKTGDLVRVKIDKIPVTLTGSQINLKATYESTQLRLEPTKLPRHLEDLKRSAINIHLRKLKKGIKSTEKIIERLMTAIDLKLHHVLDEAPYFEDINRIYGLVQIYGPGQTTNSARFNFNTFEVSQTIIDENTLQAFFHQYPALKSEHLRVELYSNYSSATEIQLSEFFSNQLPNCFATTDTYKPFTQKTPSIACLEELALFSILLDLSRPKIVIF